MTNPKYQRKMTCKHSWILKASGRGVLKVCQKCGVHERINSANVAAISPVKH